MIPAQVAGSHQAVSADSSSANAPALFMRGIKKCFGHVVALAGVDFRVGPGEVVALCGDNGAGKSTLLAMLAGVLEPDEGTIELDGSVVSLTSPQVAQRLGISTVFQDLALIEERDVAANIFLGREPVRLGVMLDRRRMRREAEEVIQRLRVELPSVATPVRDLSGGQRQAVAIARALLQGSRIILMDEPTAALGVRESRRVIDVIKELRAAGHPVVVVSHNMEDVFDVADRIVVMRLGRKIADEDRNQIHHDDVVSLLVHGHRSGEQR